MYYIIETRYEGPNPDQNSEQDTVVIRHHPALSVATREVCIEGSCGVFNGWASYAHGEYRTLEEARAVVAEKFSSSVTPSAEKGKTDIERYDFVEGAAQNAEAQPLPEKPAAGQVASCRSSAKEALYNLRAPFCSYGASAYGKPWGAVVTAGKSGRLSYDFTGHYCGDDTGGDVIIHKVVPGAIVAFGQKCYTGGASESSLYLIGEDGEARKIGKAEATNILI